ncbi:hypothetical protein, partial [Paraburkholderia sp. DGU8]|uniref:hypothetical protein n=1 Tax=Paraburkholderia sp. DGU8 TaxID=3161997 RepID=UPI00346725D9
ARSPAAQSERSSCNSGTNCIRNPFKQRPGCHNEAIFNSLLGLVLDAAQSGRQRTYSVIQLSSISHQPSGA